MAQKKVIIFHTLLYSFKGSQKQYIENEYLILAHLGIYAGLIWIGFDLQLLFVVLLLFVNFAINELTYLNVFKKVKT